MMGRLGVRGGYCCFVCIDDLLGVDLAQVAVVVPDDIGWRRRTLIDENAQEDGDIWRRVEEGCGCVLSDE